MYILAVDPRLIPFDSKNFSVCASHLVVWLLSDICVTKVGLSVVGLADLEGCRSAAASCPASCDATCRITV